MRSRLFGSRLFRLRRFGGIALRRLPPGPRARRRLLWSLGVFERELLVAEERTIAVGDAGGSRALACSLAGSPRGRRRPSAVFASSVFRSRVACGCSTPPATPCSIRLDAWAAAGDGVRPPRRGSATRCSTASGRALSLRRAAVTGRSSRRRWRRPAAPMPPAMPRGALGGAVRAEPGSARTVLGTVMTVAVPVRPGTAVCGVVQCHARPPFRRDARAGFASTCFASSCCRSSSPALVVLAPRPRSRSGRSRSARCRRTRSWSAREAATRRFPGASRRR